MASVGIRRALAYAARDINVTVDLIELPPEDTKKIVIVVYEYEVLPKPKLERQILMAQLEKLAGIVRSAGLEAEIIGREGRPNGM